MAIEAVVAKVSDLRDGDMKEVVVGETKVLLTRIKGKFHAVGAICTHYGGQLAEGILHAERVYCPWHQSVFNAITGDSEEPPGFDAVPRFEVRIDGENVVVRVPDEPVERRTMPMARRDPKADGRTFIILGGGGAGLAAAETLRQDGFQGRLVMISRDSTLSYDRPQVSKGYLKGDAAKETMPWRAEQFYRDHDIEVLLDKEVTSVDAAAKTVKFKDGSASAYDSLLLATGGIARRLEAPGADLANIFTLRSMDDADRIIAATQTDSRAVIVGASFIGMEVAQSLTKRGAKVTVVAPGKVPFERILGQEIGHMWQKLYEKNGVAFRMQARVNRLEGQGRVQTMVLSAGEHLPADLVVVGIGVKPATAFVKGITLDQDGGIPVDRYLKAADGLYAAGDIARFPDWRTGEPIRVEHWRLALQHGRIAAHNMAGRNVEFVGVPFFWSEQFDTSLQYVGYAKDWDDIIFHGDPADRNLLAFYVKNDQIMAVAGLNHEKDMAAIMELMGQKNLPPVSELRRGPVDWLKRLS
jgi:NADPH-dependent 2,4-dienoyl-CoA reductase/sulfur reductase-like enzyme/nitrite reductase/ring-hydroxylating ferredoxin subunit